ncbi:MAG: recombinase family protein [Pleurocapsa sp. SU_196_0]|nr:recombinase family protein [Pleurocapsa sp. SU_196_0]
MFVGYARVSTQNQQLEWQRDALEKLGCTKSFTDVASGATSHREGLETALEFTRQGDTLVVWKLDRLGRSLKDLIERVNELQARGIGFKSVQENIDTTTANGVLFFHIFGAIAQFERELIRERTLAGLQRGRLGGRPQALDERTRALAVSMYADSRNAVKDICATLGISRTPFYRYLDAGSG